MVVLKINYIKFFIIKTSGVQGILYLFPYLLVHGVWEPHLARILLPLNIITQELHGATSQETAFFRHYQVLLYFCASLDKFESAYVCRIS
jgi:hypothetical protein